MQGIVKAVIVISALTLAPAAEATADPVPVPVLMAWAGTNEGWAALPGVQAVEAEYSQILSSPMMATYSSGARDGDRVWFDEEAIVRDGLTRVRTKTSVSYLTDTRVCSRSVSKKRPATISADKKATFTCRSRTPDDVDQIGRAALMRPTTYVRTSPNTTEFVAADSGALAADGSVLRGAVYAAPGSQSPTDVEGWYQWGPSGVTVEWPDPTMGQVGKDRQLIITSVNVPKLPAFSSLKRH